MNSDKKYKKCKLKFCKLAKANERIFESKIYFSFIIDMTI